jgi:hypothetical protein
MEVLNRYIGGGGKRDPTTDLLGIENSDAKYDLVPHGSLAAAAPTVSTTPPLQRAGSCIVSGLR